MKSSVMVTIANVAARTRSATQAIGSAASATADADGREHRERPVAAADPDVLEQDPLRVRADAEEGRVPEREVAGEAAEHVPGRRQAPRT